MICSWDSWDKPCAAESAVWVHDIFRQDDTLFDPKDVDYIKQVTGAE